MGSVQSKIAVMVEAPVDNWHGNRSQFLPARGWRFNTHPYQNVFLVGKKKKKNQGFHSGAQCHDPCILVTWPQAESYLKGDFLLLAHHFLYISSITYVREMSWFYAVLVS